MSINTHDEQLLKKLAVAMTGNPRATTQDLAEAAGISRATFNRFCGSRENLVEMVAKQAENTLQEIVNLAKKEVSDYATAILELIEAHFDNQEYLIFACGAQNNLENAYWNHYLKALDTFFLNGQKAGVFRLDLSNQMLAELFVSMISGMIDAKYRGRVAASGIENKMSIFFMNGAAER
jgi:TetR/AcrR family transcriptional repressor of mexCD-oprJ operon